MLQWDSCTVTWHSLIRAVGLRCKPLHDGPVELALTQAKLRCPSTCYFIFVMFMQIFKVLLFTDLELSVNLKSLSVSFSVLTLFFCREVLLWMSLLGCSGHLLGWTYTGDQILCYVYLVFAIRSERRRHIDSSVGVCFRLATGLGFFVIVKRSRGFTSEITWKRRFSETTR